jgi:hypothetical protein
MSTSLRNRLSELASSFASSVLAAIRGASLDELVTDSSSPNGRGAPRAVSRGSAAAAAPSRRRGGRLPRRSAGDIAGVIEQIVTLLKNNPGGLRAEQIREELGLQAKELPRPLKEALDSGRLSKSGQKRATTYFAKGAGAGRGAKAAGNARRKAAGSGGRSAGARKAAKRSRQPKEAPAPAPAAPAT